MRSAALLSVLAVGFAAALPPDLPAHGGQYRGPLDVVPPNPGGRGPTTGPGMPAPGLPGAPGTPRPGAPVGPGGSGPSTGGGAGPRGGGGGPGTGGMSFVDDTSRWAYWWEFNKDPFLKLKEAVHDAGAITRGSAQQYMGAGHRVLTSDTLKPTRTEILGRVLPALARALDSTDQRDIASSCMVAMAKIGEDTEEIRIVPTIVERLSRKDQEVRETAAVALGISQRGEALDVLVELVRDTDAGRQMVDRSEVDDRTRSFAIYGAGLIAHASSDTDVKRRAFEAVRGILRDESIVDRNVRVAAIHAIGLIRPDSGDDRGAALLEQCDTALDEFWSKVFGPGEQLIQAHVPTAVAKLFRGSDDRVIGSHAERLARWRAAFLGQVRGDARVARSNDALTQSSIIALGRLTAPDDEEVSGVLEEYMHRGKDQQSRYFAMMALGEIGGEENRRVLLRELATGKKMLEKPWAALALGVMVHRAREASGDGFADAGVGRAMLDELRRAAAPDTRAALAIGLGLAEHVEAADTIREMLIDNSHQDELAGYLAVSLALMGDARSTETIREIVAKSVRRPVLLQQAAIALGKLGDKRAADLLTELMGEGEPNLAKMSAIASALGFIGDRHSIDPLVRMLHDEGLTEITRAFAAVALGGVADKEMLPWNSKIGSHSNYRAAVETLTNQASGILDIL